MGKKSKKKLTSKQLFKIRSAASKKGWKTKHENQRGKEQQLEAELKAFRSHREAQAAEERAAKIRLDALLQREKLTKEQIEKIEKERDEAEKQLMLGRKAILEVYTEIDFLYERRVIHFTVKQYNKLLMAEQMHEFDEMAWEVAEEMDEPVSEIYDLWLSP
jgi:hypothetical protein